MMSSTALPPGYDLRTKYAPGTAPAVLTGVQAIARLLIEQHERDARGGLRTGTFVSGYPGSPLGSLDMLLLGMRAELEQHDIRIFPGVNEELAATAVWGTQQALAGSMTHDGVVGIWYGKTPGVDRACDALRHANMLGAHPRGGALAFAGDDPACKSSTLPGASEAIFASLMMPVFSPRDAREVVLHGFYGIALSRFSGCWSALKITSDVADGVWTVEGGLADITIAQPEVVVDGKPWTYAQAPLAAPPYSLHAERDLYGPRWAAVRAFIAANAINTIDVDPPQARFGIVAPGKTYADVRQALCDLDLHDEALASAGIRLLHVGVPFPLEPRIVERFADGLDEIFVVEEKRAFVEPQVRDILYGRTHRPRVFGKLDEEGRTLVPADGELTAGRVAPLIRRWLGARVQMAETAAEALALAPLGVSRSAYFCSGCPHNRSTNVPEGSLAGGGIGCHSMAALMPRTSSQVTGITQMGGEGAQWIGQAPFTDVPHLFQNIGDGTFFHSGQLAVQACVAANVNITFKILYNSAVAMTGGQNAAGALPVPALAHKLHAEGVKRIIVCADEPEHYPRGTSWPPSAAVWHRDRLDEAQRRLREVAGVTVLIYDQQCATEARRLRKRGKQPDRLMRVVINERVCEGCGDCGIKSNCLSVQPVETEFGRKTRIDQSSCNKDYSCLDGDCPSFVTVTSASPKKARPSSVRPPALREPAVAPLGEGTFNIFLAGVGGTGVVTANQVLATAAMADGLSASGVDQTGLSQKAGPVTSHLRIARPSSAVEPANRVTAGRADCYLALDLLVGADEKSLSYADANRTAAVVSTTRVPTGAMVSDAALAFPVQEELLGRIRGHVRDGAFVTVDSFGASKAIFGDTMAANFIVLGAAYQAGMLPISAASIEWAIGLNGVAVETNVAAFRWGRCAIADPPAFAAATAAETTLAAAAPACDDADARTAAALVRAGSLHGATRRIAEIRVRDLLGFGGKRVAAAYLAFLERVWSAERALGERTELSEAVAIALHRLTAYKDEYEVARLLTGAQFADGVRRAVPDAIAMRYRLHPPLLRALGLKKKIALGGWATPLLRGLAALRRLRGTPFDPFGGMQIRRLERALLREYRATIADLLTALDGAAYDRAVEIARAPELVRGYEHVKLASVGRYRARLRELGVTTKDGRAV